jgi:hypothetical protein
MAKETMSAKQARFTVMIAKLIMFADSKGYRLTVGDAFRDPRVFGHHSEKKGYGRKYSLHKCRLAMDFNLFKEVLGKWVFCQETEDHQELGEYWESIGGSWGGRFNDGNHYSLEHDGFR